MEKEKARKTIAVLTVLCGLLTLISISFPYLLQLYLSYQCHIHTENASSIGIIGGADGPTAIFLSGRLSSRFFTVIFALFTILGILYLWVAKRQKNRI